MQMDGDVPKTAVISYPNPPAEYRNAPDTGSCGYNLLGDTGPAAPRASDLGAFHVRAGDTGTAGTPSASVTSSGVNNNNSVYSIPINKPAVEDQTKLQIEGANLEEAEDLTAQ